jgi:hypothetical protein
VHATKFSNLSKFFEFTPNLCLAELRVKARSSAFIKHAYHWYEASVSFAYAKLNSMVQYE